MKSEETIETAPLVLYYRVYHFYLNRILPIFRSTFVLMFTKNEAFITM